MLNADSRMTVLQAVALSEGCWERGRFDRAFPPGWFADQPPNELVGSILYRLKREGLIVGPERGDRFRKYAVTDRGRAALQDAGLSPGVREEPC